MKIMNHDVNYIFSLLECYAAQIGCLVTDHSESIGCPETSAANLQYALRNIQEERTYHLQTAEA
jgi:hypothetical protein